MRRKLILLTLTSLISFSILVGTQIWVHNLHNGLYAKESEIITGDRSFAEGIEMNSKVHYYTNTGTSHEISFDYKYKNGQLVNKSTTNVLSDSYLYADIGKTQSFTYGTLTKYDPDLNENSSIIRIDSTPSAPVTLQEMPKAIRDFLNSIPAGKSDKTKIKYNKIYKYMPLDFQLNIRSYTDGYYYTSSRVQAMSDYFKVPLVDKDVFYVEGSKYSNGELSKYSIRVNGFRDAPNYKDYLDGYHAYQYDETHEDFDRWDIAPFIIKDNLIFMAIDENFYRIAVEKNGEKYTSDCEAAKTAKQLSGLHFTGIAKEKSTNSSGLLGTKYYPDMNNAAKIIDFQPGENILRMTLSNDKSELYLATLTGSKINLYIVDFLNGQLMQKITIPTLDDNGELSYTYIKETENSILINFNKSDVYLLAKENDGSYRLAMSCNLAVSGHAETIPKNGFMAYDFDGSRLAVLLSSNSGKGVISNSCLDTLIVAEDSEIKFACSYHLTADDMNVRTKSGDELEDAVYHIRSDTYTEPWSDWISVKIN